MGMCRFPPIAVMGSPRHGSLMTFQCCYCDQTIERSCEAALRINLSGLWGAADGPTQDLFAHSKCAAERFAVGLSPRVPFVVEVFQPD